MKTISEGLYADFNSYDVSELEEGFYKVFIEGRGRLY
jgi:hypothetical protein